MPSSTVNRAPDLQTPEDHNVGWFLLPRRASTDTNMTIVVQRFEPGGRFAEHRHDLLQYFYVTKGEMELTIGGETGVYAAGDFVSVDRGVPHSGSNAADGESELLIVDYWPPDSDDRIGLD